MASLLKGDVEVGSIPRGRNALSVAATLLLNNAGGVIAGKLQPQFAAAVPQYAWGGDVLIEMTAFGMKLLLPGPRTYEIIGRELASGIGGWIGEDIWDRILN